MTKIASLVIFIILFSNTGFPQNTNQGKLSAHPELDWEHLSNPIYQQSGWSVKDACLEYSNGYFYVVFSAFFYENGRERSHVVCVRTADLKSYSQPLFIWSGMEQGWTGMCSPNISKSDGKFYLTYNSWGDAPGKPNQLFYAVSTDLEKWESTGKPLAPALTAGKRSIDAAMIKYNGKWFVVWKEDQTPRIAWSDSLDADRWKLIGTPAQGRWFENAEFLRIDNKVNMLVTGSSHKPNLCQLIGDPAIPESWLNWTEFQPLDVAQQSWNTESTSNSGFLADFRNLDGYYYLLYAGCTEKISHHGRGDNKLGLARSKDLQKWDSLPEMK